MKITKSTIAIVSLFSAMAVAREERELIFGSDGVGNDRAVVSLQDSDGDHFCGGTLIAANMVLTAGHCLHNVKATDVFVEVGSNRIGGGTRIQGKFKKVHEQYARIKKTGVRGITVEPIGVAETLENDIAILRLQQGAGVGFKQFDRGTQSTTSGTAVSYGWGLNEQRVTTTVQQRVNLQLRSDQTCLNDPLLKELSIEYLPVQMMCAGTKGSQVKGTCNGDSGGPVIKGNAVIGITSYGHPSCRSYSVFTTVSAYRNWIDRTMKALRLQTSARATEQGCDCNGSTSSTDVGKTCSNWLDAPIDWCYTSAACASAVKSSRYEGKFWTECIKSPRDEFAELNQKASVAVDTSLGVENFQDRIPLISSTSGDDNGMTNNYIAIAGAVVGTGLVVSGVVYTRRRRTSSQTLEQQVPSPSTVMTNGQFSSTNPMFGNQQTQAYTV